MRKELPKQLQNAVKENTLVVFSGSGLSRKFNLPTWTKLVEDIIKEIGKKKYNFFLENLTGEGVMTAMDILQFLTQERSVVKKYIQDNFQLQASNIDLSLHKKIIELSGKIITTNYDNAFELADTTIIPTLHVSKFNVSGINKNEKKYIFKIHGCYSDPDTCLIFKDDYDKLYSSEAPAIEKLKAIFSEKTILFIGFSFDDTDITQLLVKMDKLFDNNNKHYIITTDPSRYKELSFLESIDIAHYSEIDMIIDDCLLVKKEADKELAIVKHEISTIERLNDKIRVAFLYPNPIDIDFGSEFSKMVHLFENLECEIYKGFLNIKSLQSLDDFDYVIIVSKCFKGKIYIEDESIKSQLLSIDTIFENIPNENIIKVIITDEPLDLQNCQNWVNISSFKNAIISKFVFKFLRNCEIEFSEPEIKVHCSNLDNFITKGVAKVFPFFDKKNQLDTGKKNAIHLIGRIEEQAMIIGRLLGIIDSNKLLNIKGSGGIGKTTLVKKVSNDLINRGYFKYGISFVSCENVESYSDFKEAVTIGFKLQNILDFKKHLIENKVKLDLLIILDNFETVANLHETEFVKVLSLLEFITDYANIVLTSRETLGLQFEDTYNLTQLLTDDALKLFSKDYGEVTDIKELSILRRDILEDLLNNNPLAIKLVTTSRNRLVSMGELKTQLEENFFESTSTDLSSIYKNNSDVNIERTKSIYQCINYSYQKLNTVEKLAFELLHLFPDGISLTNFKKCFLSNKSANNITGRELKSLKDKSLLEDDNGILFLQPIIRKFAEFRFAKLSSIIKQKFYTDAYAFNCYIMKIIDYVSATSNISKTLKFHNQFKNNLLNVLDYIRHVLIEPKGRVREKQYLLNYIYNIDDYIHNDKQVSDFQKKKDEVKDYFNDIPCAEILIQVLGLKSSYYHKNFDVTYEKISELFSPNDIDKRVVSEEAFSETRYKNILSEIHSMEGHTIKHLSYLISNNMVSKRCFDHFFYLGITNARIQETFGFYQFEYNLMFEKLDIDELKDYIDSLHNDLILEMMQCTYTLSKIEYVEPKQIIKLVVTNPYTQGLKELMFAFAEIDDSIKEEHFKNALTSLYHIKYYYLEALYFYCLFLKETNSTLYEIMYTEGLTKAKNFHYQYLHYKFKKIEDPGIEPYFCNYSYYNLEGLEKFVEQKNAYYDKYVKNNRELGSEN